MSKLLRLQDNICSVYCEQSRDFQLLWRLIDCIYNGNKNDCDEIVQSLFTKDVSGTLLPLLQSKLGFFTNKAINNNSMRIILDAFPTIMKYKGSKQGIIYAINTFVKIEHITSPIFVQIVNTQMVNGTLEYLYKIKIGVKEEVRNSYILDELLKYIIPTGYIVEYVPYDTLTNLNTKVLFDSSTVTITTEPESE